MIDPQGEPFGIAPIHVFLTVVLSALAVLGFLWRMTRSLANMEFKLNLMWKDFQKKFKMEDEDE